jgi:antitoxin CptB|tara:strand:+ start:7961 stop:8215 length:255 start_codon:yes stop_codon:yes gene_type:complete
MDKELLLRETIYKSIHRGCKENDILIGDFARSELYKLSEEDLSIYTSFLKEDDVDIYDWILKKQTFPKRYNNIMNLIQKFHNIT